MDEFSQSLKKQSGSSLIIVVLAMHVFLLFSISRTADQLRAFIGSD